MKYLQGKKFKLKIKGIATDVTVINANIRKNTVTYQTPDGLTSTINLLEFIVMAIPLVNVIIDWIIGLIHRFKKSR